MYNIYTYTHEMLAAHCEEDTMCAKWQNGLGSAINLGSSPGTFGDIYLDSSGQEMLFSPSAQIIALFSAVET